MKELSISKAFTLLEPGPVTLITTSDAGKYNMMALSWHIVLDFTGRFAVMTGPWNYSYKALMKNKECVVNIPGADLLEKTIGAGTTTGSETDKFTKFNLTPLEAGVVSCPLIKECIASIECRVIDHIKAYDLIILDTVKAWIVPDYKERHAFHYRGDGNFILEGKVLNYRKEMAPRLAPGV